MSQQNLQALNETELKKYLSDHRNDNEKFSAGLQELMNRDIWTTVDVNNPIEEEQIIKKVIKTKEKQ